MVRAPVSHVVDNDYKIFELLPAGGLFLQGLLYLGPDTCLIVATYKEAPEVEAELSDDFSWWSPSSSGSSLRFADARPCFIAESYSTVVKPSLAVPAGQGIVDAVTKEYFEMLDVGEIGLRQVSVPEVECFWIWMVGVPAQSRR